MKTKKVIALTWGGTGGHIYPLVALQNYLKEEGEFEFIWIGEEKSLEEKEAKKNNIPFFDIAAGKLRRYFDIRNFYEPLKNFTGFFQGIYYILKYRVDIVFSKWGYVSLPLCFAAKILWKKIYVHESDTVVGISNKIIGKLATKIFTSFPLQEDSEKYIHSGQIVNPRLIDGLIDVNIPESERLRVLVIWGSQGARNIFKKLLRILPEVQNIDFTVILGSQNTQFRADFEKYSFVKVYHFISQEELGKVYKDTDIAITRGGATSLWELYYFGIHSIIIPLSTSAGNHQTKNAQYFHTNFWSNVIEEGADFSGELLLLLQKYSSLRKAGLNLENFFEPLKSIQKELKK